MSPRARPRWIVAAFAVLALACGAGCSDGEDQATPRYAQAASALSTCVPAGPSPTISLDRAASSDETAMFFTPHDAPPFKAFVQVFRPGVRIATGGELVETAAPSGATARGATYYAATLPPLVSGVAYDVSLQVVQYTNLAPECQKSFTLALGAMTR